MLAVSGGVDSMVLLDMAVAVRSDSLTFIVAHFDHGIRDDSVQDEQLVNAVAVAHGLEFITAAGQLGPGASESVARQARYKFLQTVRQQQSARAIITAHHQDDLLETAAINLLRGTKWQGIAALGSSNILVRPLLDYPKSQILDYAVTNSIEWREDSTNCDVRYTRNHIRHNILPRMDSAQKEQFLMLVLKIRAQAFELQQLGRSFIDQNIYDNFIQKSLFRQLPLTVGHEITAQWLRLHGVSFDTKNLERIVDGLMTLRNGKKIIVNKKAYFEVLGKDLALRTIER